MIDEYYFGVAYGCRWICNIFMQLDYTVVYVIYII